ncbi:MAG TPA: FtsX-like permease family protein [Anaerolineales bacterium]|nr:FtsX-like permease family protein [Anaerolineales bacterium]
MKPRWRKVIHDLLDNKARTLLVVFSIAVGVFSIGVIAGAYQIIGTDLRASYSAVKPSNIEMRMALGFDDDLLEMIRNRDGVADAEGRRAFNIRVRTPGTDKWITLDMFAFDDFEENSINLLNPIAGQIVPKKREVLLEKEALKHIDTGMGQPLEFQLPDGSTKIMPVVGIVQDIGGSAGDFLASPTGYITKDTLPYLGQPELFNRAVVTVSQDGDDIVHIRDMGAMLKDKVEKNDNPVVRTRFAETHKHPLADTIKAVLGILLAIGVLVVFLSSSLIANTLSALLNQHLRYIGVIKLVGGQRRQVFLMYLTLIMAFGVLALLIAVPLGGQGAYALASFAADKLHFNVLGYRIVPMAFVIQVLVGLLVPLIAGLVPVRSGSSITVLRALSGGVADGEKQAKAGNERLPWFDWAQVKATRLLAKRGVHIPRPFVISLRNTFRRKSRLLLTLFTLTMGGAIFIAVFNVRVTLHEFMGVIENYFVADVTIDFDKPYRLDKVEQDVLKVPGIQDVEGWQFASAEMLDENKHMLQNISLLAPPTDSKLVEPMMVSGRWLRPNDVRSLTISESVLKFYPNLKPGDFLNLKIDGNEEVWQVVGIFKFMDREGILGYAPFEYIAQINGLVNRSVSYRVVTDQHDRRYQDAKAEEMDKYLRDLGYKVRLSEAGRASLDKALESLDILVTLLLIMAVLTAIVGSMGLAGTMGMNVMERTREIGIMRAIGADDRAVMRTVMAEGVFVGMISFVLAVILSVPFTYLLADIISRAVFQTPIPIIFTYIGYAIWLGLVLVLSAFASILPARNAARLTIREVLAYE